MSEYQYYEFRAVDRPLDKQAMDELRQLSSRAEITPRKFVNVYNYGDFRGNPRRVLEQYFDAFLYVANWGTHRLMLKLPRRLFDVKTASLYGCEEGLTVTEAGDHVLLDFRSEEEGGEWEEGSGRLPRLLPLRDELLAGDLRCLYLGWLSCIEFADLDPDTPEPPVPPGLRQLSPALKRFVSFMWVDLNLVRAAAAVDTGAAPAGPSRDELAAWLRALPAPEKDDLLVRLVGGDEPQLPAEVLLRFREARAGVEKGRGKKEDGGLPRRTVAELLAARDARDEKRRRLKAERQAREEEQRAKEQAAARAKHLDALAQREAAAWKEAEALIATKLPKKYDEAVALLQDLRELGERAGRKDAAEARIREIRGRHSSKRTLIERMNRVGLPK